MLAQRKYQVSAQASRRTKRRKKPSLVGALLRNRMVFVVVVAVIATSVLSIYAGAFARATETGYERTDMLIELKALRLENESLRLRLEELRRPEHIASFAIQNGMEQGERIAYLRLVRQPHLAQKSD